MPEKIQRMLKLNRNQLLIKIFEKRENIKNGIQGPAEWRIG